MKRIFILALVSASFIGSALAQGEMDAFTLSYNDLRGTARSVGMGGAFGALGGDISGIAINPAGIGVYKTSEVATTANFSNVKTKTDLLGSQVKENKFNFGFDNFAFVGVVPLNSDIVPLINFGFSYNRLNSFDRKYTMEGNYLKQSQTGYIANRINGYKKDAGIPTKDLILSANPFRDGDSEHWLGALFYNTGMIVPQTSGGNKYNSIFSTVPNASLDNYLNVYERGAVDSYDFNAGTTFGDILSFGVTLSVTDINYRITSLYSESMYSGNNTDPSHEYDFENELKTEGSGWQVKTGLIFKPVKELRIGVAYHSPTWYNMTDTYSAYMDGFNDNRAVSSLDKDGYPAQSDYKFRTPDKWVLSLAGVIGQQFILSADYELTNYSKMNYKDVNGYELDATYDIKESFKNASTLRVGAEVRFTPQFSGRVGYMWQQSPVKDERVKGSLDGKNTALTAGTITNYSLVGDANYFTYGLGYRFTRQFYTDIAFVMKSRTDDLYSYAGADRAELKTNAFSGVLTLGYKF